MIRLNKWICTMAVAAMASSNVQAATVYWQNNSTGTLTQNNYSDGTNSNLLPMAVDIVNFGNGGTATHSVAGTTTFSRLRVGHSNPAPAAPGAGGPGQGTVTINLGAISLAGASGVNNAGLTVGQVQTGRLDIDGPNSSVTVGRLVVVGLGTNTNRNGTINITNGGSLTATLGNMILGESSGSSIQGIQGRVNVNGNLTLSEGAADLVIGPAGATSAFTQTGGTVSIGDFIDVGAAGGTNDGTTFSISGGTTTSGVGGGSLGNFFVGRGATTNATLIISGGTLNVGNRFLMGAGTATGAVTNHSNGTLNIDADFRIADAFTASASDATYNFSGGTINSIGATSSFVGRQGVGRLFQTGGDATFSGALAIGNRDGGAAATNGLYEISAGQLNVALAMSIATNGVGEFRVTGDEALIDVDGDFTVDNTANGLGTLAYELENAESLSMIDVAGTASFNAGASLLMDASNAAPGQFIYDLLTATSIVDNGIAFSAPAGWSYRIISGGNGQILQAIVPEPGTLGLALLAVAMAFGRRRS
jgi:hypothetical protein